MYSDTYDYSLEMRSASLYSNRKVKIFVQGSYANNTNVRTESDVDIAIVQEEVFFPAYKTGITGAHYGFTSASIPDKSFKDEVQECLEYKFGSDVERKNKSIKIHGNTYRKDTDTVPCRRYRDYTNDNTINENNYIGGIVIIADDNEWIINYPEQHISNGRQKDHSTKQAYKRMVRIIKKIRYLMMDYNYASANKVSSFVIESLLWNIPNDIYTKYTSYRYAFDEIVKYAYNYRNNMNAYKEANGIKPLCPTQTDINNLQNFLSDLKNFYDYDI